MTDTKDRKRLHDLQDEIELQPHYDMFKGTVLIEGFKKHQSRIENFDARDGDVWVTSFPKSGTTWVQEMTWLLANNLDYKGAKKSLDKRYAFLESAALAEAYFTNTSFKLPIPNPIDILKKNKGRRFIKSHLPWELLPSRIRDGTVKPKIIHILRNPKDVCVSYYHHTKIFPYLYVSMEEYFNRFITDKFMYTPYWKGVISYWEKRDLPNVLIIRYEDMIKDLPSVITKVAEFLDTSVPEEEMDKLVEHLSFAKMKTNRSVNLEQVTDMLQQFGIMKQSYSLMRKGKVGSYKEDLTDDMVELLDIWSDVQNTDKELTFDT